MLKEKVFEYTLTGSTTYDTITLSGIYDWCKLQFKAPAGGLKVRVNGTPASPSYISLAADDIYEISSVLPTQSCKDTITVNGSGTLQVFVQYYSEV